MRSLKIRDAQEARGPRPEAQSQQKASTADADEAAAIASVVDSVLADLKPKLMEEIAKKMGRGSKKS
jgi:hypothetical protein